MSARTQGSEIKRCRRINVIVVGASTGGPVALQALLEELPADFPIPIVIAQHMPALFTKSFSERLNAVCNMNVWEGRDGMTLSAGNVYLAPGGQQAEIKSTDSAMTLSICAQTQAGNAYKPSVDVLFGSAAKELGKRVLGIVLTGMGNDGRRGAEELKTAGAKIWTQSADTCVIPGMPNAVIKAGFSDASMSIPQIQTHLLKLR